MPAKGIQFRCRRCGFEFRKPPTPQKATLVTCPKKDCGSDDIEIISF